MTLKDFLEYEEHRFDDVTYLDALYRIYANGWVSAVEDIRKTLERHEFDLEIQLKGETNGLHEMEVGEGHV